VKEKSLCFNCLRPGHRSSQCQSKQSSKHSNGRHHSLIYHENMDAISIAPADTGQASPPTSGCSSTLVPRRKTAAHQHSHRDSNEAHCPQLWCMSKTLKGLKLFAVCYWIAALSCTTFLIVPSTHLASNVHPSRVLVCGISSVKAETTIGLATLLIKSMVSLDTFVVAASGTTLTKKL